MGDFTGFSFGNWHSSDPETGLVTVLRVSGGDRYEEELHPEIKDRTAEVPGMNGEYYFGSDYGTRTFNIEIAYDSLTEDQFRELRRAFGTKEIKELIFDERPYKKYMAKIESPMELSYVCFDEPNYTWQLMENGIGRTAEERTSHDRKVYDGTMRSVYKGEGTISLVCYFPFAKAAFKEIPTGHQNDSWVSSSGIKASLSGFDTWSSGHIQIYNPGDIETGFKLYIPFQSTSSQIQISCDGASLVLDPITLDSSESGILINTTTGLITGATNINTPTKNIYNSAIKSGYLFHLQPTDENGKDFSVNTSAQIDYDYLYF